MQGESSVLPIGGLKVAFLSRLSQRPVQVLDYRVWIIESERRNWHQANCGYLIGLDIVFISADSLVIPFPDGTTFT